MLAEDPDLELTCVVPPSWAGQPLERAHLRGYRLVVRPIRLDGNFHLFHFVGLAPLLRRLRPDVVHVDEEPYNLATWLATRQALAAGARTLFFTWQNLLRRYPPPFGWFERDVFSRSRFAIAGSTEAAAVLHRKGYRGRSTVVPQVGVDPEIFRPRPGGRANRDPFTVGYAGRLVEEKGLFVLIDALGDLAGEWRLRLFGAGPLREPLLDRARRRGIDERVSVEGAIRSVEMPIRLPELDVLVLPSLTRPNWKEQFGRVLTEAMACEVPVVGSTSGEIPRVVGDGGLVVPEGDPSALRDALQELAADPDLRLRLGRRGRRRVLERFTHQRVAADTLAVYRRMLTH